MMPMRVPLEFLPSFRRWMTVPLSSEGSVLGAGAGADLQRGICPRRGMRAWDLSSARDADLGSVLGAECGPGICPRRGLGYSFSMRNSLPS